MQPTQTLQAPQAAPDPNLPIAALLCFLAYTDNPNDPIQYEGQTMTTIEAVVLEFNAIYPLGKVVWSAVPTSDYNYGFIVCTPSNQYIMAIRGTLPFEGVVDWGLFYNWIVEDLDVVTEQTWPYLGNGSNSSATSNVANGAMTAFHSIKDAPDYLGSKQSAGDFLLSNAVQNKHEVIITGHSLGGNMANTFASYFAAKVEAAGQSNSASYLFTFAAPSPGDATFVSDLATKFPGKQMYQYQITNDIVPLFPVYSTMYNTMSGLFPSPGPDATQISDTFDIFGVPLTATLSEAICAMAVAIETSVALDGGTQYAESTPIIVTSSYGISKLYENPTLTDWVNQAAYQHTCLHYLFIFWGKVVTDQAVAMLAPKLTKSKSAYLPAG